MRQTVVVGNQKRLTRGFCELGRSEPAAQKNYRGKHGTMATLWMNKRLPLKDWWSPGGSLNYFGLVAEEIAEEKITIPSEGVHYWAKKRAKKKD